MTEDSERKIAVLIGAIAKVVEESDCTYSEARSALLRLGGHYLKEGAAFLDTVKVKDVVRHRQRSFEQKDTTPFDKGVAGQKCCD